MYPFLIPLPEAQSQFKKLAQDLLGSSQDKDRKAMTQVITSIEQFLDLAIRVDQEQGIIGRIDQGDVDQIGEYGLNLLTEFIAGDAGDESADSKQALNIIVLVATDWLVRHEGTLYTLEPVVNALASVANTYQDPITLTALTEFMGKIMATATDNIKQDLDKSNPGRPWRILQLNRGIVATRTHQPELMEQVFDQLIRNLPDDAPGFFSKGMEQMDAQDYPPHVRKVMQRYFDAYTRPTMH